MMIGGWLVHDTHVYWNSKELTGLLGMIWQMNDADYRGFYYSPIFSWGISQSGECLSTKPYFEDCSGDSCGSFRQRPCYVLRWLHMPYIIIHCHTLPCAAFRQRFKMLPLELLKSGLTCPGFGTLSGSGGHPFRLRLRLRVNWDL